MVRRRSCCETLHLHEPILSTSGREQSVRKEVIGNATLYLGDCRELLPSLAADAVITDPPYGAGYRNGPISPNSISTTGKRSRKTVVNDDAPFDPNALLRYPEVLMTGAQYFYDRLPAGGSLHVWDKRGNYKPLDQSDADIIWRKSPGASRTFHCVWRGICRDVEYHDEIHHPTQKPVALMEWMLKLAGFPKLVLDPYMGSGTTGVACWTYALPFIGIEIDPEHFEQSCERISRVQRQERLFA